MIEHISITIPSCRPNLLIRCVESLDLYSRFSHELVLILDVHGGWERKWTNWCLPRSNYKHEIKILKRDRYDHFPSNSSWKKRGMMGKCMESLNSNQNWGITQCKYDWVLTPSDDDFYYLPDWDYHLLKHMDAHNNKKIMYCPKQLCPREISGAKHKTSWIGFEHPKGTTDPKLRERTPLKVSYALEETKSYRIDRAFMTAAMDARYGHNVPLLLHKETILKAGGKSNLLESADALWDGLNPASVSLTALQKYGCMKCSVQNSNILHYSGGVIDDLQKPPVVWER